MKKVLFVASVAGHINAFHLPYLNWFKENGFIVDVATMKEKDVAVCDNHHKIDFKRNPLKPSNLRAYKQIKKLITEGEYDIIHCHTPVAAMLTRLAARKARKSGTKVIYTAHGFHFYKGAPLLNWLIYYPVEKLCSRWTDTLITINTEDFEFAKKKMKAKQIKYVPGVGFDYDKFASVNLSDEEKSELKKSVGVPEDAKVLFSVGELNSNKNHSVIISALAKMQDENVHYCIAGMGEFEEELKKMADSLGVGNRVHLLGYRTDIAELMQIADVFCFPSKREGLPVSLMEAMAAGLPCAVSDVRGNADLIESNKNGLLCAPEDVAAFSENIRKITQDKTLQDDMSAMNKDRAKRCSLNSVKDIMAELYLGNYNSGETSDTGRV